MRHYDWLAYHARTRGDAPCWTDLASARDFTYAAAEERCRKLASHLQQACGVKRGDRVAVLAMNSTDVLEVHSACAKIGAIFLPLNWRLVAAEIDFIVSDSAPQVLIHDATTRDVVVGLTQTIPHVIETGGGGEASAFEAAITGADGAFSPEIMDHDDTWTIMYTSGTTGRPKGAPNTYGMAFWNAVNLGVPAGVGTDSITVTFLPLFHTAGLNCYSTPILHAGGRNLVTRAFDPGEVLSLIGDPAKGVTHFLGVPANYLFMSQHEDFAKTDFSGIVRASVGGAPTPISVLEAYKARGVAIVQGFGMTETSPCVSIQTPEQAWSKPGSAGRCVLHGELKIVREDGSDADPNEIGALWVRGKHITPGYWNRPEANAKDFTEGWFNTGDAARLDDDGDLWIVDRWKDMYISGGENVYPAEVENVLFALDGVADGAVIGAPDDKWGEVGVAFVVQADGAALSEESVLGWFDEKIARYKIPKRVKFIDELPRNATGKVLKRVLREECVA